MSYLGYEMYIHIFSQIFKSQAGYWKRYVQSILVFYDANSLDYPSRIFITI